jgi:hypothetical protein
MFCPLCKAEYREGFTHCNDCDVDLVASLKPANGAELSPEQSAELNSSKLLWGGTDRGMFDRICSALDEAGIEYNAGEAQFWQVIAMGNIALQIWVRSADEESAIRAVQALESDSAEDESAVESEDAPSQDFPEEPAGTDSNDLVENFYEEDATTEVWRGADQEFAGSVKMCLQENGIGCVIEDKSGGAEASEQRVMVQPANENRARQIVREIVDAIPE